MNLDSSGFAISFIIPVLNGEKYIKGCLDHICREMAPEDEIIVVDNGSTDTTTEIVKGFVEVKLLQYPGVTISALRNRGAAQAKENLLAFIDCDCLVCPGWRAAAIEILGNEQVTATGSHYDFPENPTWVEKAWLSARTLTAKPAEYIVGGNFIITWEAFEAVKGFDETMVTDEDTEIGTRLRQRGYRIINAPQVRVIHLGNAKTIGQFIKKEKWHSTSMLRKMNCRHIDKPMLMTFAYLFCVLTALATTPAAIMAKVNPAIPVALVLLVPVVTVIYRLYQFGSYRYFFPQVVLYLLFYSVRVSTMVNHLLIGRNTTQRLRDPLEG